MSTAAAPRGRPSREAGARRTKRRRQAPPLALRATDLRKLSRRLRDFYGPQSWWPAGTELEMVVGALLVQNTAWTGARKALDNLIAADMLDPAALHAAPEPVVAELIRPSGYFNSKARKLKALAELVMTEAEGSLDVLLRKPLDELRPLLLATHGFGPETADSVCLYAGHYPTFVIDAYTRRLLERLEWVQGTPPYNALRDTFMAAIKPETAPYAEYHALVVTHMKNTCTKRPQCGGCPLLECCPTGHAELGLAADAIPLRPRKQGPDEAPRDWNSG